jgi:hypothetical protein
VATMTESDPTRTDAEPLAHLRASAAERARIFATLTPFDWEGWHREVAPATPEELVAQEAFLREREAERRHSIEHEWAQLECPGG